jgi:hypothetical protein
MASDVSRAKAPKLVGRDFAVQATISNVLENNRLLYAHQHLPGIWHRRFHLFDAKHVRASEAVKPHLTSFHD